MDDKIIATFCLCDDLLKAMPGPPAAAVFPAGAARWARGRSRGEGKPLAGGGAAPVGGARGGRAQKCV